MLLDPRTMHCHRSHLHSLSTTAPSSLSSHCTFETLL
jgi:hypothetical protein